MRKTFFISLLSMVAFALLGFTSCEKFDDPIDYFYINCQTDEAEGITPTSAVLKAKVTMKNIVGGRMYSCFYYSTEKTDLRTLRVSGKKSAVDTLRVTDTTLLAVITDLKPSTTYYFAPSLQLQGIEVMGDIRSFTTAQFCQAQPATNVTDSTATLHALVAIPENMVADSAVGFEYAKTDFSVDGVSKSATMPSEDGKISCDLTGLESGTKYYFRAYVLHNAVRIYSNVLSFLTE